MSNGVSARPDALTKIVVAGVTTIMLALLGWVAAGVADLKERMARVETRLDFLTLNVRETPR